MSVDTDIFYVIIILYIPISERKNFHMQEYVMGNGAIALGALAAGVNLVAGYPGTPSSEILETISKYRHDGVYIEWSVNEKAAMEVAAAAAYSGARAMVTMKQVGLNVAARSAYVTRLCRRKGWYGDSVG